jgi:hypothetical protein
MLLLREERKGREGKRREDGGRLDLTQPGGERERCRAVPCGGVGLINFDKDCWMQ